MSASPSEEGAANVELARLAVDAYNRRDRAALVELAAEEFVCDWSRSTGPAAAVYSGREAALDFLADQWSAFESFELRPEELLPIGSHVLVYGMGHARGRGGIEVTARSALLYTFAGGRLIRVTLYQERAEALEAAAVSHP